MNETVIFLTLCALACWVGSLFPAHGAPADTTDLLAEILRRVLRRL